MPALLLNRMFDGYGLSDAGKSPWHTVMPYLLLAKDKASKTTKYRCVVLVHSL